MPKNKSKNKDSLHLENFSEKKWDEDLNIGLKGSFLTTKILGAYMAKNKNGVILFTLSSVHCAESNTAINRV